MTTASVPRAFYFVRHGEAEHNPLLVKANFKSKDPSEINATLCREARSIVNPRLTVSGKAQAMALGKKMKEDGRHFDLCITTPLARAIETSMLAFGDVTAKFLVTADGVESATPKLAGPQRGHSKEEMLRMFPFLDTWDLSLVREDGPDPNWVLGEAIEPTEEAGGRCGPAYLNPRPAEERIAPLAAWLKERPESKVVFVGHSGVFDKLLGLNMANCELVEHTLA